jgi:hypothetical protein
VSKWIGRSKITAQRSVIWKSCIIELWSMSSSTLRTSAPLRSTTW